MNRHTFRFFVKGEMLTPPPLGEWDFEDCEWIAGYVQKGAIIMQSTGMPDNKGIEIFESDLLWAGRFNEHTGAKLFAQVVWKDAGFDLFYHNCDHMMAPYFIPDWKKAEIVGNIHEHSKLLSPSS